MSIVKLPLCYKCGVPHVPEEIASRVRSGEDITIEIISQKGLAANVLKWGTGGLNIDGCRVNAPDHPGIHKSFSSGVHEGWDRPWRDGSKPEYKPTPQGRWPANLLLSHSVWCVPNGTKRVRATRGPYAYSQEGDTTPNAYGKYNHRSEIAHTDPDGMEEVEDWQCADDCPIRLLDEQSGITRRVDKRENKHSHVSIWGRRNEVTTPVHSDTGGASRYFQNFPPADFVPFTYQSKASRAERNAGCEGLPEGHAPKGNYQGRDMDNPKNHLGGLQGSHMSNTHPTVKPLALMRWLVRLITPPDGIVLDPFCGSGSTLVACIQESKHFIGIEQDESYTRIAEARIAHARREVSP